MALPAECPARPIDFDAWPRRDHFAFFRDYEQPFFNVCVDVDVGSLLATCRASGGPSFFISTMYASMRAANDIESFRYRIRGGQVVVHDVVHAGSTVLLDDERFAFAYFAFTTEFSAFLPAAEAAVADAGDGRLDDYDDRDDLTYHSILPWIPFTSFAHARRGGAGDSIPRVVLGGYRGEPGAERMPVSVEVHHALMDGIHVARFIDRFQAWIDKLAAGEATPARDAYTA